MVYKRYIKKDGKIYGPYIYHSRKENGKVVSQYLGKTVKIEKSKQKKNDFLLKKTFAVLGVLVLFSFFIFYFESGITGKVSISINENYKLGEAITGSVKVNLKNGELLPANTKLVIDNVGRKSEYLLKDLVDFNLVNGSFFIENKDVVGEGVGFGVMGVKEIYPKVNFVFEIIDSPIGDDSSKDDSAEPNETEELVPSEEETPMEEEPVALPSIPQITWGAGKETSEEEIESEAEAIPEEPNGGESGSLSPLTGGVISTNEIEASVSVDLIYTYDLPLGMAAKLLSSEQDVILDIENGVLIVTTDYSISEEGFGQDYLTEEETSLQINLANLNLTAFEGDLIVSLVYQNSSIISKTTFISVEGPAEEFPKNDSGGPNVTMEIPVNISLNETNVTQIENITNVTLTNETLGNLTIQTIQYNVTLNKPVKWIKKVSVNDSGEIRLEIPKDATNISVFKIIEQDLNDGKIELEINESLDEENGFPRNDSGEPSSKDAFVDPFSKDDSGELSEEIEESQEAEGDERKDKKANTTQGVPQIAEGKGKKIRITAQVISGEVSLDLDVERKEKSIIFDFFKNLFNTITGRVVFVEQAQENKTVIISPEENVTKLEVEYETPGPISFEDNLTYGKQIIISDPNELGYKNILAYTILEQEVPEHFIKLYHLESPGDDSSKDDSFEPSGEPNSLRVETPFVSFDTNNNSLVDYIEWVVPHLSNQTYEVTITVLNVQSYPTVGGNWSVRFNTTGIANLTISAVNDTTFGNSTPDDLKFLEIRCGENLLQYTWVQVNNSNSSSVRIENYTCDNQTGIETKKVMTPGVHDLEFDFGGVKAYAHNFAVTDQLSWTFFDNFDDGVLGSNWTTYNSNSTHGRTAVLDNDSYSGSYSVLADIDFNSFALNENELETTYDFSAYNNSNYAYVSFWYRTWNESNDSGSTSHIGHDGSVDGIYFTCDANLWYRLGHTYDYGDYSWRQIEMNLSEHANFCSEINSSFAVKFVHYGNARIDNPVDPDGYAWDDISIRFSSWENETTSCGIISYNTLVLEDLFTNATCFTIGANDITLDCGNHVIDYGNETTGSYGVDFGTYDNVTIRNCIFNNSITLSNNYGIEVGSNDNLNISNNSFYNAVRGINGVDPDNLIISHNYFENQSGDSIYVEGLTNTEIFYNDFTDADGVSGYGIYFFAVTFAENNTISYNSFSQQKGIGMINIKNISFNNNDYNVVDDALWFFPWDYNGGDITFTDEIIDDSDSITFNAFSVLDGFYVDFVDVSFNDSKVSFVALNNLTIRYGTLFRVFDSAVSSSPLNDVFFNITDGNNVNVFNVTTHSGGYSDWVNLRDYMMNGTDSYDLGNHTISLAKIGYYDTNISYNATSGGIVNLEINSHCGDLSSDLTLDSDISSDDTCIDIVNSDVTLDCAGYTINYSTTQAGYGIRMNANNNVTIKNCNLVQIENNTGSHSINLNAHSNNNTFFNNNLTTNGTTSHGFFSGTIVSFHDNVIYDTNISVFGSGSAGIYFNNLANRNNFSNIKINSNASDSYGIYFLGISDNNFTGLNLSSNGEGIYFSSLAGASQNNLFINSTISGNPYALTSVGTINSNINHVFENVSFVLGEVNFSTSTGDQNLTIKRRIRGKAVNETGSAMSGVTLNFTDVLGTNYIYGQTDANGFTNWAIVPEIILDKDANTIYNNYTLKGNITSYNPASVSYNITSTGTYEITMIYNDPPYIYSGPTITPSVAYSNESTLNCNFTVRDTDTSTGLTYEYYWYNNSVLYNNTNYSSIANDTTYTMQINADFKSDEIWNCTVRAHDGVTYSTYNSTNITILNSHTIIQNSNIVPISTAGNKTDLIGYCNSSDVDNDYVSYNWQWYKDDSLDSSGSDIYETVSGINYFACEKNGTATGPYDCTTTATSTDYGDINSSDGSRWITELADGDSSSYDSQIYRFNITKSSGFKGLAVEWEGYGENDTGYYTNLSIWNWSSSSWYELDNYDFTSNVDSILSGEIINGYSDFINSTDRQVAILAVSAKNATISSSQTCGNGIVEGTEECDSSGGWADCSEGDRDLCSRADVDCSSGEPFDACVLFRYDVCKDDCTLSLCDTCGVVFVLEETNETTPEDIQRVLNNQGNFDFTHLIYEAPIEEVTIDYSTDANFFDIPLRDIGLHNSLNTDYVRLRLIYNESQSVYVDNVLASSTNGENWSLSCQAVDRNIIASSWLNSSDTDIDTTKPFVNITSPLNTTYTSDTIALEWTNNEALSGCAYSLNGGVNLNTICGVDISEAGHLQQSDGSLNRIYDVVIQGDYAYVVSLLNDSLTIIDVSNPTSPSQVGTLTDPLLDNVQSLDIRGNYVYLVANNGLRIVDVSNVSNLEILSSFTNVSSMFSHSSENLRIDVQGDYAYVTSVENDSLTIINVTNELDLVQVGFLQDATNLDGAYEILVEGDYAYVTARRAAADYFVIINVSSKTNPTLLDYFDVGGEGLTGLDIQDDYAYVAAYNTDTLFILNITNKSSVSAISNLTDSSILNGFWNLEVRGNYVYGVSSVNDSLSFIDVTDKTNPFIYDYYSDTTFLNTLRNIFILGNYAYVVADSADSLTILDIGTTVGNTTLTGLSQGNHNVTIYSTDIYGNMNQSSYVLFQINVGPPNVKMFYPENKTYGSTSVYLSATATNAIDKWLYNLDDGTNNTFTPNTTVGMTEGAHQLFVYANDTFNQWGLNNSVFFNVDSTNSITINSPADGSIFNTTPLLDFSGETLAWCLYELDKLKNYTDICNITGLSNSQQSSLSDSTGFDSLQDVYVQGDYAYVVSNTNNSFSVVEIVDSQFLTKLDSVSTALGGVLHGAKAVFAQGDYAYVASTTNNSLTIIDITDKRDISILSTLTNTTSMDGVEELVIKDDYAYLISSSNIDSLTIINISNKNNPVQLADLEDTLLNNPQGIGLNGDYAYVVSTLGEDLIIVNVTNKTNPVILSNLSDTQMDGATGISVIGNYAYVVGQTNDRLSIVNVTNKSNPILVGDVGHADMNDPIDVSCDFNYCYVVSTMTNSLVVFDTNNKTNPIYVDTFINLSSTNSPTSIFFSAGYSYIASSLDDSLTIVKNEITQQDIIMDELSATDHNVTIYGYDLYRNFAISANHNFSVDGTAPTISVISPRNKSYSTSTIWFNATASETISSWIVNYNGTNTTLVSINSTLEVEEGFHHLLMYASDSAGNWGVDNSTFFTVDLTSPTINIIYPVNDTTYFVSDLNLNWTVDENVASCSYSLNGATNDSTICPQSSLTKVFNVTDWLILDDPREIKVIGDILYTAASDDSSIVAYDVTDPTNPVFLSESGSGGYLSLPESFDVVGDIMYVASTNNDVFIMINVSNVSNMVFLGWDQNVTIIDAPRDIEVEGNYAYLVASISDSFTIYDVTDKNNPSVASYLTDASLLNIANAVDISGNYAYVGTRTAIDSYVFIINVTDKNNPEIIGNVTGNPILGVEDVFIDGDYLYVVSYLNDSLSILDVSDKTSPFVAGYISSPQLDYATAVDISGNYAYVTSIINDSVSIIDITNKSNPFLVYTYSDVNYLGQPYGVFESGSYVYATSGSQNSLVVLNVVVDPTNITLYNLSNIDHNVTIYATDLAGNLGQSNYNYFTVTSSPASVTNQVIIPDVAYSNNDLNCSASVTDDLASTLNVSFMWYKNDVLNYTYDSNITGVLNDTTVYTDTLVTPLTIGDSWICSVRANDGAIWSDWSNTTSVAVQSGIGLSDCQFLDTANTIYNLMNNVSSVGTCFNVTAQNVTLDCNNYEINYSYDGTLGYGFYTNQFNSTIKNCNVVEGTSVTNYKHAINLAVASNGTIFNNTIITIGSNSAGVYVNRYEQINFTSNSIDSSGNGVEIADNGGYSHFENNVISSGSDMAMSLNRARYSTFINNNLTSTSSLALELTGYQLPDFNHTMSGNLVGGNALYYGKGLSNFVLNSGDYGEIIFFNSDNVTIENLNLSQNGLFLFYVDDSNIQNNNFSVNSYSVRSYNSFRNNASNNNFESLIGTSLAVEYSDNWRFEGNEIKTLGDGSNRAISLLISNNNYFYNNTVFATNGWNSVGIRCRTCANVTFESGDITTSGQSNSYGIYFDSGDNDNFIIRDSMINAQDAEDFFADNVGGSISFVNVSFDETDVVYDGTLQGYVSWYLDVNVTNATDNSAISGALVNGTYSNATQIFSELTAGSGFIEKQNLTYYKINATNTYYENLYVVDVTSSGFASYNNNSVNISGNVQVNAALGENTLPTVTLDYPTDGAIITNRSPRFNWTGNDNEGNSLTYEINITLDASSLCSDLTNTGVSSTGGDEFYLIINYLECLKDNEDWYNWTVRAHDGIGWGPWATVQNMSVQAVVSIILPTNAINFSSLGEEQSNDTINNNPLPIQLENDGNALFNISVNASDLWQSILGPSQYYQYKIDNSTEINSFTWLSSITTFTNMPNETTFAVENLGWINTNDSLVVDINVTVPVGESSGDKNSIIVFTAGLSE